MLRLENIPMSILKSIVKIYEFKGKHNLYKKTPPEILKRLQEIATVQSIESSNRIEGIEVSNKKLKEIINKKTTPQNPSEAEISGYSDVLATIHASALHIPIKPSTILQLHRNMHIYLPHPGGCWKVADNVVENIFLDGSKRVRFRPLNSHLVPFAMEEICEKFNRHRSLEEIDDILLVLCFILDFLCVHPFSDGNGRISRLLKLLLLYQAGFEVGRFISLERIIEQSKETYYESLFKSSQGWQEGIHNPQPWIEYSLGVLLAAYKEFEEFIILDESQKITKTVFIKERILTFKGEFSMQDIEQTCPNVSRPTIYRVLDALKNEGVVNCIVPGRHARWARKTE